MAELVDGLVLSREEADWLLRIAVILGRPHDDEIRPGEFEGRFGPEPARLFEQIRDFRFAAESVRASATVADAVGNCGRHDVGACVIDDADAIDTATAGRLLDLGPRRVRQLIDEHAICAVQVRPHAQYRVSRASVLTHATRGAD